MNKIALIVLGVALIGLTGCDTGCDESSCYKPIGSINGHEVYSEKYLRFKKPLLVKIDNHIYLFVGHGMVHYPDCPCHVKEIIIKDKLEK